MQNLISDMLLSCLEERFIAELYRFEKGYFNKSVKVLLYSSQALLKEPSNII